MSVRTRWAFAERHDVCFPGGFICLLRSGEHESRNPKDMMRSVERPLDDEPSHLTQPREVVHFWRRLGLITAGGVGLRLLVVVLSRHEKVTGDGYEWSAQGNLNAASHWFVSPFTLR